VWPPEDLVPGFKESITEYYRIVDELGKVLFRIFAKILGQNEVEFMELVYQHSSSLNLTNLKLGDEKSEVLAPHGDITCFTIISHDYSDNALGSTCLQVLNPKVSENLTQNPMKMMPMMMSTIPTVEPVWISLNQEQEPSFLVNLGQIMERWSNGRLKATLHRLRSPHELQVNSRRQAIVYFQTTNYNTMLKVLQENGIPPKYQPEIMSAYSETRMAPFYTKMDINEAFAIYNKDIITRVSYLQLLSSESS